MNKLLSRNLLQSIQSLNQNQLVNVLLHYEEITGILTQKTYSKTNKSYKCIIETKGFTGQGFGRKEEEALHNASKSLFEKLITSQIDIQEIKQSLKYKNKEKQVSKMETSEIFKNDAQNCEQNSFLIDQISMIQPRESLTKNIPKEEAEPSCNCVFYEVHRFRENQIKHLQARINLLTQQNVMLKKLLIQGGCQQQQLKPSRMYNKQNSSFNANI